MDFEPIQNGSAAWHGISDAAKHITVLAHQHMQASYVSASQLPNEAAQAVGEHSAWHHYVDHLAIFTPSSCHATIRNARPAERNGSARTTCRWLSVAK